MNLIQFNLLIAHKHTYYVSIHMTAFSPLNSKLVKLTFLTWSVPAT